MFLILWIKYKIAQLAVEFRLGIPGVHFMGYSNCSTWFYLIRAVGDLRLSVWMYFQRLVLRAHVEFVNTPSSIISPPPSTPNKDSHNQEISLCPTLHTLRLVLILLQAGRYVVANHWALGVCMICRDQCICSQVHMYHDGSTVIAPW